MSASDWPADAELIARARALLNSATGRAVIACDSDVDGLASAVIVRRALSARGVDATVLPVRRGEHVHSPAMRERIHALTPDLVVILDMGSRPAPLGLNAPALVLDHHDASQGVPPDALVVNGWNHPPVATTSVLAYLVCRDMPGADASGWLATLGAIADLGSAAPFAERLDIPRGATTWSKATSLLNAGRRAPQADATTALEVLEAARDTGDIIHGRVRGVERLQEYRTQVQAELDRCSRVAPQVADGVAIIRFSSGAQVHPVVATRWTRRLAPAIVIAANDGYLPGRVNFAVRSAASVDLLQWLRSLPFTPSPGAQYANGHARATGGSLVPDDFERFVAAVREVGAPATAARPRSPTTAEETTPAAPLRVSGRRRAR